jgi:predicted heme/steroid binding protein
MFRTKAFTKTIFPLLFLSIVLFTACRKEDPNPAQNPAEPTTQVEDADALLKLEGEPEKANVYLDEDDATSNPEPSRASDPLPDTNSPTQSSPTTQEPAPTTQEPAPTTQEPASTTQEPASPNVPEEKDDGQLKLTLTELAMYNGKDGNPAYIAVDGVIYDVTNHPAWSSGSHRGRFEPGKDYTVEMKTIPRHGTTKLDDVPAVGLLIP